MSALTDDELDPIRNALTLEETAERRKQIAKLLPSQNVGSEPTIRAQVLREAESLVVGDREQQYGHPRDNLQRIADYWNVYLQDVIKRGGVLEPRDVALMMVHVKVAREAAGHKRDSCVDGAGYFSLAAEVA
jgi:hypothetical protein